MADIAEILYRYEQLKSAYHKVVAERDELLGALLRISELSAGDAEDVKYKKAALFDEAQRTARKAAIAAVYEAVKQ